MGGSSTQRVFVHNVLYTRPPRAGISLTAMRPLPPEVGPEWTWLIRPGRAAKRVFDKSSLRPGLAYRCTGCALLCNELLPCCSACMCADSWQGRLEFRIAEPESDLQRELFAGPRFPLLQQKCLPGLFQGRLQKSRDPNHNLVEVPLPPRQLLDELISPATCQVSALRMSS